MIDTDISAYYNLQHYIATYIAYTTYILQIVYSTLVLNSKNTKYILYNISFSTSSTTAVCTSNNN